MNNFCNNCGTKLNEEVKFCGNCGHKLYRDDKNDVKYASFGIRLISYIIDLFVIFAIGFCVGVILGITIPEYLNSLSDQQSNTFFQFIGFIITWLYYAIMESSNMKATLGKKVLNLEVVNYENEQVTFLQASIRFFSRILSMLLMFIGYIMIIFNEKKQGLHDIIAKTYVVYVRIQNKDY